MIRSAFIVFLTTTTLGFAGLWWRAEHPKFCPVCEVCKPPVPCSDNDALTRCEADRRAYFDAWAQAVPRERECFDELERARAEHPTLYHDPSDDWEKYPQ